MKNYVFYRILNHFRCLNQLRFAFMSMVCFYLLKNQQASQPIWFMTDKLASPNLARKGSSFTSSSQHDVPADFLPIIPPLTKKHKSAVSGFSVPCRFSTNASFHWEKRNVSFVMQAGLGAHQAQGGNEP